MGKSRFYIIFAENTRPMKIKTFSLSALLAIATFSLNAAPFAIDGIYYELSGNSQSECYVTFPSETEAQYKGTIDIPAEIEADGKVLKVSGIGQYAFSNCTELTGIKLPESIEYIGRNAFSRCVFLSEISLPDGIEEINEQTFYNCCSLERIEFGLNLKSIGNNAFAKCSVLNEINLPEALKFIGDGAFRECSSLNRVEIPEGATEISPMAFQGCVSLCDVTLPSGLQTITDYCFDGCSSLENIELPASLTSIGERAFGACVSLENIELPESLTRIDRSAFELCVSLSRLDINNESIELGDYAFSGCSSLTDVVLNGVTSLGRGCFMNCTALDRIYFSEVMKRIDNQCFQNCMNISLVYCPADLPPALANTAFEDITYKNALLSVSEGLALLYMQTPPWSYFLNVYAPDSGVEDVMAENLHLIKDGKSIRIDGLQGSATYEVYSLDGRLLESGAISEGEVVELNASGVYMIRVGGRCWKVSGK